MPHALKAWIDIIVQPIAGFTINEQGEHVGMLGYRVDTLVIEPTTRWTPGEREQMRSEAITLAGAAGRLFS